jgi:hypothetical protein
MRPLNLDAFRRVAYPKIPKGGNRILAALQGDNEMVRASNRYWNFAYRNVKRCDAWIERSLGDNATCTPKEVTHDAGCKDDYGDNDYKILGMSKFNGWINKGKKSDKEQSKGDGGKGYLVDREPGPNDANQQKQRRSEKRDLTKYLYL